MAKKLLQTTKPASDSIFSIWAFQAIFVTYISEQSLRELPTFNTAKESWLDRSTAKANATSNSYVHTHRLKQVILTSTEKNTQSAKKAVHFFSTSQCWLSRVPGSNAQIINSNEISSNDSNKPVHNTDTPELQQILTAQPATCKLNSFLLCQEVRY